jgi:hypothetical protein
MTPTVFFYPLLSSLRLVLKLLNRLNMLNSDP